MNAGDRVSTPVRGEHPAGETGLGALAAAARAAAGRAPPPVERWNPPFCGEIDMRIASDGSWHYQGSPIGRPELVRLFASILRRDPERFVLVTPVECVGIRVDDAPFLAVEMEAADANLVFRTNVDDVVTAGPDHPLRFEREPDGGLRPYLLVRGGLWARVLRPVYFELVEAAETREVDDMPMFGVSSGGTFFPMAPAAEIEDLG